MFITSKFYVMMRYFLALFMLFVAVPSAIAQTDYLGKEAQQSKARFESRLNFGGFAPLDNDIFYGWNLKTDFGARLKDRVYVGGEVTILCHTYYPFERYSAADLYFVVAPNVKYYPRCKASKLRPYAELSLGTHTNTRNDWGMYLNIGGGIDFNRFNISLGYRLLTSDEFRYLVSDVYPPNNPRSNMVNTLYIQFGVRFGK